MDIKERIESIPDEKMVTIGYDNRTSEFSVKAKDLKQLWATRFPGDPHPDSWMRERVNTLP